MDFIKIIKEGKRFSLGEMNCCEGELMSIAVSRPEHYRIGDIVQCNCFGMDFQTKVLKKDNKHIYVYAPIFNDKFPEERRRLPRIDVNLEGVINDCISAQVYDVPAECKVNIVDLNIKGFGLVTFEPLKKNFLYYLHVKLGKSIIKPKVIIRNELIFDEGYRYGCEVHNINHQEFLALRSFILVKQLTSNPQQIIH